MAIYMIGFAVSLALIAFAEKKRTVIFITVSIIALLIPCLIAALRAQTIGTDVMVYVKPLTQAALLSDDLTDYFNSYWFASWRNLYAKDYDIGFSLMLYLVSKLTKNLGAVLFTIEALMVVPIYIALSRNRKKYPIWIGMLVFYLLFYNCTLNMMRQWIAMSFLLLATQLLTERKFLLTAALTIIACLFHSTAIIAIPLYLIYWLLQILNGKKLAHNRLEIGAPILVVFALSLIGVLALMNLPLILKLMTIIGMDRFNSYLIGEEMHLMVNQIILRFPLFALLIINYKDLTLQSDHAPFYTCMLLFDTIAAQLLSVDEMAFRIASYFSLYSILWLPQACASNRQPLMRKLSTIILVAYCVFYWYYNYVYIGRHGTYPYVFAGIN